ncbi:MAG: response regulator transcription factor [Saprospiraceae bacterium]|nr:response regulator transcription factor [Saprospiraceae bacterium]
MSINLLIIHDHQLFIEGLKSILQSEIGITVIGEANSYTQLENLLQRPLKPDVILCGAETMSADSRSLAMTVSKLDHEMAILILSPSEDVNEVYWKLDNCVMGYLTNRCGRRELLEAIHKLSCKKNYLSRETESFINQPVTTTDDIGTILLTHREKEITTLVSLGRTSAQISVQLNISKLTVDTHRKNIYKKLKISNTAGLIRFALGQNQYTHL